MSWGDPAESKKDRFSEELLESENDRHIENVASKVSTLKHIVLDLKSEAKDQVRLVNESGSIFEDASLLLSNSFKRVQGLRRSRLANCKYMWYFALVGVVFLLIVWILLRRGMS